MHFCRIVLSMALTVTTSFFVSAQNTLESTNDDSLGTLEYQASDTRYFDLLHTSLDVSFDWDNQYLLGKANLELTPIFFPQNELVLDAKGMAINEVSIVVSKKKKSLNYEYDGKTLRIQLGLTVNSKDTVEVFIDYILKN